MNMQLPVMHVFRKQPGKILHFWATELREADTPTPPADFRSVFLEKNYLKQE